MRIGVCYMMTLINILVATHGNAPFVRVCTINKANGKSIIRDMPVSAENNIHGVTTCQGEICSDGTAPLSRYDNISTKDIGHLVVLGRLTLGKYLVYLNEQVYEADKHELIRMSGSVKFANAMVVTRKGKKYISPRHRRFINLGQLFRDAQQRGINYEL